MRNFKSLEKPLVLLFLLCLFPLGALAQNLVKGTVIDVSGEPIIGASVKVVGAKSGGITDANGQFNITAASNAQLEISYVGYVTQKVSLAGRNNIRITLTEDTNTLNDVVVIGYGVQKKSDLTGAVASVKSEDLMNRSVTDAAAAIQGKAAGVQILNGTGKPGAGANIRVRGYSSNSDKIGPLLIVDGLQVTSIQYLDPSMIESMEVLKDAASAAIYGAEAGNGVILITTKSGSKGKGSINYNIKLTNQGLGHVGKLLNAAEFQDWMGMQIGADVVKSAMDDAVKTYGWNPNTDTDWMDEYFENTWAQQHTLTFQGGNDRGSYFLSTSYVNQDGIVKGNKDKYERLTAQINADYKIKDWLTVGTNTSIEKWRTKGVSENGYGSSFEMLLLIDPMTPLYWTERGQMYEGTYREIYDEIQNGGSKYTLFGDENGYYASSYFNDRLAGGNPFAQRDRSAAKNDGVNVNGTAFMNITPIKQITFTSRLGYRLSFSNSSDWSYPYYINNQTGKTETYSITGQSSNSTWYQWENFINYNQDFGLHNVGVMAGMSYRQSDSNYTRANASGPDILKAYEPNYIYIDCVNGNTETTKNINGIPGTTRALSYFGRFTYNYDNRYGLQVNYRRDAYDSSRLAKDNRWGNFLSASAGWTFSNEKFFKDAVDPSIMSFGKIRVSWGTNGNVNVLGNSYAYTAGIATNSQWYQFGATNAATYGSMPNGIANPDLTWEKSKQIDLGADFRFLNDRLALGLDWYKKTTKDLLVSAPVMPESGASNMTINAGEVENSGFEMELSWKDHIGDFKYSIAANMGTLHNEVTYLDPSIERIQGATVEGASPEVVRCYFEEGEPVWYMRGYKYAGRANGTETLKGGVKPEAGTALYYAKDGSLTNDPQAEDMTNVGSGLPDLTYGLTINAEYKGFDLTVFGAGQAGNDVYYGLYRARYHNVAKGVYDDFKSGKLPKLESVAGSGQFWRSSAMVYNGSFFKIKQIQLGYTLPKSITKKAFMENVRAYISLDDFFTFTSYPGLDPETCTQEYNCPGLDKGVYPTMKKLVLGLSVTF